MQNERKKPEHTFPRIYHPNNQEGSEVKLEDNASRHLLKVLRLKMGNPVILFDGKGKEFKGILSAIEKNCAVVKITDELNRMMESPLKIHLAYALARFEKTEWVIQKATELGVNEITLLMTQHSEVHLPKNAIDARLQRWRLIVISACEQSGRLILPEIKEVVRFDEWIRKAHEGMCLMFHPSGDESLSSVVPHAKKLTLLVGAEGGFSEQEVKLAIDHAFKVINLGPRILRTETAAISALSITQALWGDLINPFSKML